MNPTGSDAHAVLSTSVARLVSKGARKIMITSSGPGEGKSTVAAKLGQNLARSGRMQIAVVDADAIRPSLHRLFQVDTQHGLSELLEDVYHVDLGRNNTGKFGVGDWVELIRAQGRTGRLDILEGNEAFSIAFERGRVSGLFDSQKRSNEALRAQREGSQSPGDTSRGRDKAQEVNSTLQLEWSNRLYRILALRQPMYRFSDVTDASAPEAGDRLTSGSDSAGADRFIRGKLGDKVNQPYLSDQVPNYLIDTPAKNLKILTIGGRSIDLRDPHFGEPFVTVIDHLAQSFDAVLIDSPPVAFDTPTAFLAPAVDGVLLVVKAGGFDVGVVQQAKDQLLAAGANILGVVLNQANLLKEESFPYYHYHGPTR